MKLITEEISDAKFIAEGVGADKSYYIQGTFLQPEIVNRNGRLYSRDLMEREVSRYHKNYIVKNRALGEMGHPNGPGINLDRVSHMITELYPDGDNYTGKAKILDTPYGKIVKNFLDEGIVLAVSSRGVGTLKPVNGFQKVQDDFMLATAADIVADPSAPDAFVQGIMEGKEWILENGSWTEIDYDKTRKELKEASIRDFEEKALNAFKDFLLKV